ncbi:MAG: hypothetical protein OXT49_00680 [Gammaproteobacteria bacterium]|nr:hypothetical protein [Gammaproteobacteria bacterium]
MDNTKKNENDIAAVLGTGYSDANVSLVGDSSSYYGISGQNISLTAAGAGLIAEGNPLPLLALTDGKATYYYKTVRSTMSDGFSFEPHSDHSAQNNQFYYELRKDSGANEPDDYYVAMKAVLDGVAKATNDKLLDANVWLYSKAISANHNPVGGDITLHETSFTAWSDDDVESTFTKADQLLAGMNSTALGTQTIADTNKGDPIDGTPFLFELSLNDIDLSGDEVAFVLVPDDGSKRNRVFSETNSDNPEYRPHIDVSFETDLLVAANDDEIGIREGSSNTTNPYFLLTNDAALNEGERSVAKVNGITWSALPDSTHFLYTGLHGFKEVQGAHGVLYVRESGRSFYQHNGSNVWGSVTDEFTYTAKVGSDESPVGTISVIVSGTNQPPVIDVREKNFTYSGGTASASAGDVVATISLSDPDEDVLTVLWTNGGSPKDIGGNALYEISNGQDSVLLTEAGAAVLNAGDELAAIRLVVTDGALQDFDIAWPFLAKGRTFFIDQTNGAAYAAGTNDGESLAQALSSFDELHLLDGHPDKDSGHNLVAGDTVYIVGEYKLEEYDEDFFDTWDAEDIGNDYMWVADNTIKLGDLIGTESMPITIKGWDENSIIKAHGLNAVLVDDSQHVVVRGLEIDGVSNDVLATTLKPMHFVYRIDTTKTTYTTSDGISYINSFFKHASDHDYFFEATPEVAVVKPLLEAQGHNTSGFGLDDILANDDRAGRVTIFDLDPSLLNDDQLHDMHLLKVPNAGEDAQVRANNVQYSNSFIKQENGFDYFYRVPPESTVHSIEHYYHAEAKVIPKTSYNWFNGPQKPRLITGAGINFRWSQHMTATDNFVHDIAGAAIGGNGVEYYDITHNKVERATGRTTAGTMCIVVNDTRDDIDADDYKLVIANNQVDYCFNEFFSFVFSKDFIHPALDEGKGISPEHQSLSESASINGRMLLSGNLTILNGVSGVNVHNGENADILSNTSYMSSLYATVWGYHTGPNIGVTTEHDFHDGDGFDNQMWNNLGVVDGALNGNAVTVSMAFRDNDDPTQAGGGNNATATLDGGRIRYDQKVLDIIGAGFYAPNATDLVVTDGNVLADYINGAIRPAGSSVLVDASYNVIADLANKGRVGNNIASVLNEVLSYDVHGVKRDLDNLDIGALESYSVAE